MSDQIEGRNPVLECLTRGRRRVLRVWIDRGAKSEPRLDRILALAAENGVPVEATERPRLDKMSDGRVHNGIIAHAEPLPALTMSQLVDQVFAAGRTPFFVMADEVSYEHNLGAILRSALGFGADGVVIPTRRGAGPSPVVERVSMGAIEEVPLVREGLYSALKVLKKAGIRVVGADMGGVPHTKADLCGALALLMGGEGSGLGQEMLKRCDLVVAIPLAGGLESLNLSVAASILMCEKRRQDGWF